MKAVIAVETVTATAILEDIPGKIHPVDIMICVVK
jgi:hypothetical protein